MIVVAGYANRDLAVAVPRLPGPGERVQARDIRDGDGGMAANAAVAAAAAGAEVRFAGVVGPDLASTAFLDRLTAAGVDVSGTARTGRLTTALVLVTPDGERAVVSQDDDLDVEHLRRVVDAARVAGAGLLYLDGYRFPAAADVLQGPEIRSGGLRVVVDLDGADGAAAVEAALGVADHVVLGRAGATAHFGGPDGEVAAAVRTGTHVVTTLGADGWRIATPEGARLAGPAPSVDAVDTTGAGDCFVGTYCAGLDGGLEPAPAARTAAAAAALSCTRPGARDGIPSQDSVRALLGDGPPASPLDPSPSPARPQEAPCAAP